MWFWDWSSWIWNSFHSISSEGKALIVAVGGAGIKWWMDSRFIARLRGDIATKEAQLGEKERRLEETEERLRTAQKKIDDLRKALRGSDAGIWTTFPPNPPTPDPSSHGEWSELIVLTIANNKGGVGKTTLAGNLLAYFDNKKAKRVLAIDMDYQGSLSTMLKAHQELGDAGTSNVNSLLAKGAGVGALFEASRGLGRDLTRSNFVSAFYDLALLEDRLLVDWLLQEDGDDVRYRLANVLRQPEVRKRFDLIIIDVPPRLTTGTINALCASTHVLIPTIFNPIAAEPVPNFLGSAIGLMSRLNRSVNFVGVVETMAPPPNQGQDARRAGRLLIEEALRDLRPRIEILAPNVPRRVPIAEGGIAYLENNDARAIFNELGDEVSARVGL